MGIATDLQLQKLYGMALALKNLEPWKWMQASQFFIIHDNEKAVDGFCSFSDLFEVSLYLGEAGFQSYRYLHDDMRLPLDHVRLKGNMRRVALTVNFHKEELLTEKDIERAQRLGYGEECPIFRAHHPDYQGTPLFMMEEWQCKFFTQALEQALEVARLQQRKALRIPHLEDIAYLLRYEDNEEWVSMYANANLYRREKKNPERFLQNDLLAYRVKKLPKLSLALEVIQFYVPQPVVILEKEQSFFMLITAVVDAEEGQLFYLDIQETKIVNKKDLVENLAKQLLELQVKPTEMVAEDQEAYDLLVDFCKQVGIKLSLNHYVRHAHDFVDFVFRELQQNFSTTDTGTNDIDRLLEFVEEITETLYLQEALEKLSASEQQHYKLIIQTFILAMYTIKGQIPTEWDSESVEDICLTVLPEQLETKTLQETKGVLLHFITLLGEDAIIPNYQSIIQVIKKCL